MMSYTNTGGPQEVERPSIDKMTLAEMESVIKADLEKRDKEKQDKYQEPLDSQKEKGKHLYIYNTMVHYRNFSTGVLCCIIQNHTFYYYCACGCQ